MESVGSNSGRLAQQTGSAGDVSFVCPNESGAITRAVHLGRLASGWLECLDCPHRSETHGLSDTEAAAIRHRMNRQRSTLRRSEFGVRGRYLNDLNRAGAAILASIFSRHLMDVQSDAAPDVIPVSETVTADGDTADAEAIPVEEFKPVSLVLGYDGRSTSPDIFAGVLATVLQNGCEVHDIGRCTAGSMLQACRSFSHISAGMLVTGSQGDASDTGIDVFDADGEAISVPWHRFGVRISLPDEEPRNPESDRERGISRAQLKLHQIREAESGRVTVGADAEVPSLLATPTTNTPTTTRSMLQIPSMESSHRVVRCSGTRHSIDFESKYRQWVQRWYPRNSGMHVVFLCHDELVSDRLHWLAESTATDLHPLANRSVASAASELTLAVREQRADLGIRIEEDDRFHSLVNRHGRVVAAEELSQWLNKTIGTSSSHVTAHVSSDKSRLLLLDAARPNSTCGHETVCDSLAILGLILSILGKGKATLPGGNGDPCANRI